MAGGEERFGDAEIAGNLALVRHVRRMKVTPLVLPELDPGDKMRL